MFYVMMCPNCGTVRGFQVSNVLRRNENKKFECFHCGKNANIFKSRLLGLAVKAWGPYESQEEMKAHVQIINGGRLSEVSHKFIGKD